MLVKSLRILLALCLALPLCGSLARADTIDGYLDGVPGQFTLIDHAANTTYPASRTVDVVGSTQNMSTNSSRAKGNAYRIDTSVTLNLAEFYLNFTDSQTLMFYVFVSPVEFGTYTEVYRGSRVVSGMGAGWYASDPLSIPLTAGNHYIIAVSWSGVMTYYYGSGDSQATSFGAHVHGYATGTHPMPISFESLVNDQAIYHQRITTNEITPTDDTTWGAIKQLYR